MDGKNRKTTLKRYIISGLVVVLSVSLLLVFGNRGQEDIPEKCIIEATHNYLVNRAEQLQGNHAFLKKHEISWAFKSAVMDANREAIYSDDGLGKSVEVYLDTGDTWLEATNEPAGPPEDASDKIPTWSNALKMLAQNSGNGLWAVSIGEWELEFNERTNEVRAGNNEAAKLLEEITLRTYHNTKYGYSVDYPPEWNVLDTIEEGVSISSVSTDGTMVSAIFIYCLPKILSLSLRDYAEQRVESFRHESYQIGMAEGNLAVGGVVADIVSFRFDYLSGQTAYDAKWYFTEKDDKVYEILSIAVPVPVGTYLFDPYASFQFQP